MAKLKSVELPPEELKKIIEDENIPKFLLDTNVILAYLNSDSQFHTEAKTSIEGIKAKKAWFVLPYLVIGEYIAHKNLVKKKCSINEALKILNKFDKSLNNRLVGGTPLNLETITGIYLKHARHRKLTSAGFSDFMILAEAETIKNIRILTCDKKMYKCGKSIFGERIYYLPNQTKDVKSDYPELMRDIQNNFKK
jgi:predicted nucleic acid-binding protein